MYLLLDIIYLYVHFSNYVGHDEVEFQMRLESSGAHRLESTATACVIEEENIFGGKLLVS